MATIEVLDDDVVVWTSRSLNGAAQMMLDADGVVGDTVRINQNDDFLHIAEIDVFGNMLF